MYDAIYHQKMLPVMEGKRRRLAARANHHKKVALDRLDCAIASLRSIEAATGYAFIGEFIDAYCHQRELLCEIDIDLEKSDDLCTVIDLRIKALTNLFLLAMEERGYRSVTK